MKCTPPWLKTPEFQEACKILEQNGFGAHAVGGCVRDAIADVVCNDIDIATKAHPKTVEGIFFLAGWAVYPTGIDHGTVTIRKGDQSFEVTTYRHDVATDGRRATVEYAETMEEDAQRRDFTMNALYMDRDGNIFDPTGTGVEDIVNGIVRFVGDSEQRCKEDYLRIMRLFRFHAKYGCGELDAEAANAAQKYKDFLPTVVSGERIWSELKKILALPEPFQAVKEMDRLGVLREILPDANLSDFLAIQMPDRMNHFDHGWERRFYALHGTNIPFPHAKSEQKHLDYMKQALYNQYPIAVTTYLFGEAVAKDVHVVRRNCGGWNHIEAERGKNAKFPVCAADLMQLGFEPGPEMGELLRHAQSIWIETCLVAEKDDLIELVVYV